jgi:hypothetical protein
MGTPYEQIRVPAQDGTLLQIDHLPDVQDLVSILESEAVPLQHWWDLARAYLAQGRAQQYLELLQSSLDPEFLKAVEDFFKRRPSFEIVLMICGIAAHHTEQYRAEPDKAAKQEHYSAALARVNAAKQEGPAEQLPWLASGALALAKVRAARAAWAPAMHARESLHAAPCFRHAAPCGTHAAPRDLTCRVGRRGAPRPTQQQNNHAPWSAGRPQFSHGRVQAGRGPHPQRAPQLRGPAGSGAAALQRGAAQRGAGDVGVGLV